jgi:hypothetical protein
MNYNAMTDLELLHYLDIYSDDPLIRRLIEVLEKTRGAIISDLEDAGMDPQTWTFGDGWEKMFPGQYITDLENRLRYAEDELDGANYKLEQAEEERDKLKTRNIMQFIEEVWQEKRAATHKVTEVQKEINRVTEQNAKLREQIDMWGNLNRVKQGV